MAGTVVADTWKNGDGTENFKCRAWVNFNGTGTVAIRASGNVSSITDNGTGDYTVNFTTAMPDSNYSYSISSGASSPNTSFARAFCGGATLTSNFRFVVSDNNADNVFDTEIICVQIFR